jgi:CRISPR-associated protein Csm5
LIFPKNAISQKLTDDRITDLRPMIRNGMGQLYIPGSSIKGAIRTAIAYYLLKHGDRYNVPKNQKVSEIEKKLRSRLGELGNKHKQKSADDDLFMDTLFSEYNLIYQGKKYNGSSQNTDFLRALSVSDCEPLIEGKITTKKGQSIPINLPIVAEVIVSSRFPDYLAKYKASLYVEMVRNVQTTFNLTLDTEMLSWFQHKQGMKLPFQNLEELLKICQEFTQEQWDYEHDYWNDIENNPRAKGSKSQVIGEGTPCEVRRGAEVIERLPNIPTQVGLGDRFQQERDLLLVQNPDDLSECYPKIHAFIRNLQQEASYEILAD